jgi:antitoxin component of MazEF toxin-antitoxin module
MQTHRARLIEGGKLIIPAAMRKSLGLATGDIVTLELHDGDLRIKTQRKALAEARAILREHVPAGVSLVDELIAERHAEERRE